jgi:hypothetical protein
MVDARNRQRGQNLVLYSESHPPHTMMRPTTITFIASDCVGASQYEDNVLPDSCKRMLCH